MLRLPSYHILLSDVDFAICGLRYWNLKFNQSGGALADLAVILDLEVSVVGGDGGCGWVAVGDSDIKASQEVGRSGCAIQNQSVTH